MAISSREKFRHFSDTIRRGTEIFPIIYNLRDHTQNKYIKYFLKICLLPFSLFRYFFPGNISTKGREGLAFVLIAKNEAPYIEEWINFHHKQGVSHFFIYDNESTDNFHEVLVPYIESGLVTYHVIKGKVRQVDVYNMAIHDYGRKFRYMGFIDADEFVFVRRNPYREGDSHNLYDFIDDFMNAHKNAGGIAISWLIFGTSGHITKPEGGVLKNFTKCAPKEQDPWTKTICDPLKVMCCDLHRPYYVRGYYNLDETGEIVLNHYTKEKHFEQIRINHYVTKSQEEYIAKQKRGRADINGQWPMSYFEAQDRNANFTDTEILSRI